MQDDNNDKWNRLPKVSFDKKAIRRRMKRVETATVRHAHKFIVKRWSNVREVQRHVITWIVAMGLLIAATGMQLMWYQQEYRTNAYARGGTYAEAVLGPVDTLNPLFASSSAEQSISRLLFSRLMSYDNTGHLNFDLAKNVKIDDSKKIYTIEIRSDVKWTDGYVLDANDIAFTLDLIKDSNTRTTISGWDDITYKVINGSTIQFSLNSTYAAFQHALTFPIVPKHILKDVKPINIRENDFSQNPIGSGPFKFRFSQSVDQNTEKKVVYLAANESYYDGVPGLARFQLHVYGDSEEIIKALAINEVNAASDLSPVDISSIDSKRYEITSKPIMSGMYALINTQSAFLKDLNLRKALQAGTNVQAIRDKMPAGTLPLDLPFLYNQITGDLPRVTAYDQNLANNILDQNGWKLNAKNVRQKDAIELKLTVATVKDSECEKVLEQIVSQWRSLGIVLETKIIDTKDVTKNDTQEILQPRNYDALVYKLNIGADPDVYAYWHSSQMTQTGFNFSNYSNVIADDSLVSARARLEPELRNAKYLTFARQWVADIPAIGLYQSTAQYVYNKNVKSSDKSVQLVSSIDRYSDILDWSVGKRKVFKTP